MGNPYEQEKSLNTGWNNIFLIADLKRALVRAKLADDFESRYKLLGDLFCVIISLYQDKSKQKKLEDLRKQHLQYWEQCKEGLKQIKEAKAKGFAAIPREHVDIFDFWQYELAILEQQSGIGMPKGLDPSDAMGE